MCRSLKYKIISCSMFMLPIFLVGFMISIRIHAYSPSVDYTVILCHFDDDLGYVLDDECDYFDFFHHDLEIPYDVFSSMSEDELRDFVHDYVDNNIDTSRIPIITEEDNERLLELSERRHYLSTPEEKSKHATEVFELLEYFRKNRPSTLEEYLKQRDG